MIQEIYFDMNVIINYIHFYSRQKNEDIFKNEQILELLKKELFIINIPKYNKIKNNYFEIERLFEKIFDFLDYIGYKKVVIK